MNVGEDEDKLLRSVALQNARAILRAQERAEQALVVANQRVTNILESITDGLIVLDADFHIEFLNRRAENFFAPLGLTKEKLLGASHWDAFPETVGTLIEDHFRRALQEQVTRQFESYFAALDVWYEIRVYPWAEGLSIYYRDITHQRRAEEEQAWLTGVLERSLNEIYVFDTKTLCFLYVNDSGRRNLGYTLEEMRELTPVDIKPEFTETSFRAMVGRLGTEGEHLFETLHQRRNGTTYPVEVHLQRVEHGGTQVFLALILDITERRQTQDELRRSEEELRALANSIPQLAWIAKPDGYIYWYNQGWYDYTGTTLEQMAGWGWERVHDPQMLPRVREKWNESIRTGQPFEMEFPLLGADGIFRWFLTRVNPVRDSEGRVVRWFGTNTDVHEVRAVREALREETRVLELLNDTGASIASRLELRDLMQTVTDSATELTGAEFGAFFHTVMGEEGESFQLFTLTGAPREAFDSFEHPRPTAIFGPTFRGESIIRSGDVQRDPRYGHAAPHFGLPKGHLPVRSYLGVPVVSRRGEVLGALLFGHHDTDVFTERSERLMVGVAAQAAIAVDNARLYDAAQREIAKRAKVETELRSAQEELGRHAEQLETQVNARTASLRNAMAQLEEFSYTVSHDLRAPIRAISGYARILADEYASQFSGEARWLLERISGSAERMARLVDDVLTLSRVMRADVELQPMPLQQFIEDIVNQHPEMQRPAAGVTVETPHSVIANEVPLSQALSNLLANAVKFVDAGVTPEVRVTSERRDGRVRIWVADNGVGIRPEHRNKLFGMFQRLPTALKYEGTGIGLILARKAAERMGGTVGMEPGQAGSRFWIELKEAP